MSTLPKPGYKYTDMGLIPEEWEVCPVAQKGEVVTGKALAVNGPGKQRPYLRTKNVFDGRIDINDVLTMPMTDEQFAHFRVRHGDVLLNEGQSLELVGRCAMYREEYPEPCAIQNQLIRFRARDSVSSVFASYLFRSCQQTGVFARIALQTTSIAHLGGSRFERLLLAWPKNEREQCAIAGALSDVDAMIGALDQLIAKKGDLKQAAMQQLLTGQKRLPGFNGEWNSFTFGELFDLLRNASNSRADLASDGDVGYVHYGDIHMHKSQFLDCERDLQTFLATDQVGNTPQMADGDLLMADASEDTEAIGKAVEITGLNGRRAIAGLHTLLLRSKKGRLANGFKGYLQNFSSVRESLVRMATGVSVYGISKSNVRTISVTIPDLDEQAAIAGVLLDMDSELSELEQRRDKTRAIKQAMMQELLTGRIRLV